MYYVYILRSLKDKSIYIGITSDLRKRLQEHNSGGIKFTTAKQPYKIIWYSVFKDKIIAYKFERYLKRGSGVAFLRKHLI
jgi:putative endonuclease